MLVLLAAVAVASNKVGRLVLVAVAVVVVALALEVCVRTLCFLVVVTQTGQVVSAAEPSC